MRSLVAFDAQHFIGKKENLEELLVDWLPVDCRGKLSCFVLLGFPVAGSSSTRTVPTGQMDDTIECLSGTIPSKHKIVQTAVLQSPTGIMARGIRYVENVAKVYISKKIIKFQDPFLIKGIFNSNYNSKLIIL